MESANRFEPLLEKRIDLGSRAWFSSRLRPSGLAFGIHEYPAAIRIYVLGEAVNPSLLAGDPEGAEKWLHF